MKCTEKATIEWQYGESLADYSLRKNATCGEEMVEIGKLLSRVNKITQEIISSKTVIKLNDLQQKLTTLYQCPKCKTIKVI